MVVAGEASGDLHGAHLVRAMKNLDPDLVFFGIGGQALREAGVDIRVDNAKIAVVGFSEVFPRINILRKALRHAKKDLERIRPALLILIDFPDFNLRVAKAAKKLEIPVLYYISPQVWAWRTKRVKKMRKLVDRMVVIFPFEVDFYEKWNVPVTFVGHPLLDSMGPGRLGEKTEHRKEEKIMVGLLPGSRKEEVARLLPTMVRVAEILSQQIEGIQFGIAVASSVSERVVEAMVQGANANVSITSGGLRHLLEEATLVITASGTVTLEAALAGTPMIIVYKMSPLSYWLARLLVRVEYIGLANLVAERRIVPELIQHEASAQEIARRALIMIRDKQGLDRMRLELRRVAEKLGEPGASRRAAAVALKLL